MPTAKEVFRQYVTDGIPGSGEYEPEKSQIRGLLTGYEAKLAILTAPSQATLEQWATLQGAAVAAATASLQTEVVAARGDKASLGDRVGQIESDVVTVIAEELTPLVEASARLDMLERNRANHNLKPQTALIVILLGQSLNVPRGPIVVGDTPPGIKMPVGGMSMTKWGFFSVNATHVAHWDELASCSDYAEQDEQSPGAGIASMVVGGKISRAYIASVAIGARSLEVLMTGGPVTNLHATVHQLCNRAREDGYEPEVVYYTAHGEANAAAGTSEADYYALGDNYYGRAQLYAAQAMRRTDYSAPIIFTYPAQGVDSVSGASIRGVKAAIKRLAEDLPNGIDAGPIYQWPCEVDRVHPEEQGYVFRGEWVGKVIRDFYEAGKSWAGIPKIVNVTLNGTTFRAYFSCPVEKDTTFNAGQSLDAANAEDGFQWVDNGTVIAINGPLTYSGWWVEGQLASAPSGTIDQQELRIANQLTAAAYAVGADKLSGSVVRASGDGWKSPSDHTYTNYLWAIPQVFKDVRAVS